MSTQTISWGVRNYFLKLESEDSICNTDDTESIYSIQDRDTDFVKDTSDTASLSEVEYEIETFSEGDDKDVYIFQSSGESDTDEAMFLAAAVVADSSIETFITDAEDSDNSQMDELSPGLTDFWICIQCKSQNDNPQYRFCDKCFQDRKAIFPPRPKRRKKQEKSEELKNLLPVQLQSTLTSFLNGLSSQDSGIASSQESNTLITELDIALAEKSSGINKIDEETTKRKRQFSESSLSDDYEKPAKKLKKDSDLVSSEQDIKRIEVNGKSENIMVSAAHQIETKNEQPNDYLPELRQDCIICHAKPKNSIFLHGRTAHMCCCYNCAVRTWATLKRCPICKRKVSNIVKVFTS